jgi:hypothetical protein
LINCKAPVWNATERAAPLLHGGSRSALSDISAGSIPDGSEDSFIIYAKAFDF